MAPVMNLTDGDVAMLEEKALAMRRSVIEMLITAGSGHTAGPLGMADVFAYLYFRRLRHRPEEPAWPDRDRLVLSNGHICPILYAAMAHAGYLPVDELQTLRRLGSRLQGHPHREYLPALETSSGPLGSGLSQAVGMAIADRMDDGDSSSRQIYCLMSDGELEEGNTWEAAMLAGKEGIQNLCAVVDRNAIQIDGYTEDVMPLEPLGGKWRAFGWHVVECDGHSFRDLERAFGEALAEFARPTVIVARTIPGKGVPEFERRPEWHGKPPATPEEVEAARRAFRPLAPLVTCVDCD